jgi:hypothetical protein
MSDPLELLAFLHGDFGFDDLASKLRPNITFKFGSRSREVRIQREPETTVLVSPTDLRPMLEKFLAGIVTGESLSIWASVIILVPTFVRPPGGRASEFMWECLQDLSSPPIAEHVTPRTVGRLLRKLPSIERDIARNA